MAGFEITAILSGHREGRLAVATLRSFNASIAAAREADFSVEPMHVLDRPDELTRDIFTAYATEGTVRVEVNYGDQGLARNDAVARSAGRYIAMLDGDDLWQQDWLVLAKQFLDEIGDEKVVAHPEFNYFFDGQATCFRQIDQESPDFDIDVLRLRNYWDALSMCHRSMHETYPYAKRDVRAGWAHEDWRWNVSTIADGIRHKIVPDTVLFKRRQKDSQNVRASRNKCRFRRSGLASYSHPFYKHFE